MTIQIKKLKDQALLLSPEEREILAEEILHSLDNELLSNIDKAWIEEAEKRYDNYKSGKTRAIPFNEVKRNIRKESPVIGLKEHQTANIMILQLN